jgi:hypothetical protein
MGSLGPLLIFVLGGLCRLWMRFSRALFGDSDSRDEGNDIKPMAIRESKGLPV